MKNESTKLNLLVRDDVLQQLLGNYDPDDIDINDIEEKLFFLEKIAITYTEGNKVTSISQPPVLHLKSWMCYFTEDCNKVMSCSHN